MLGDSSDGDSDDDDDGVEQGVLFPVASAPAIDPTLVATSTLMFDSFPSSLANAMSTVFQDKFYKATGKVPHVDAVVPKKEFRWWINREMRKQRKAKERAKAAKEFHRI